MLNLTPILKLYAKRRTSYLAKLDQAESQKNILLNLVKKASNTQFGKEHSFSKITSVEDYQKAVPLRTYEDFWSKYWKSSFPHIENATWPGKHSFYSVTSGTTSGTTKYLPFTKELEASNKKAGLDLLVYHVMNNPNTKIGAGKSFMLGGSTDFVEEAAGIFSGDLSGISASRLPWWAKLRSYPPAEVATLSKWEEKINIFVKQVIDEDIRMISGVPAWLLIFFDTMIEAHQEKGSTIGELFPNLELMVHGGVNFSPYAKRFDEIFNNTNVSLREVYPASEAFIALADKKKNEGLRLLTDHNNF